MGIFGRDSGDVFIEWLEDLPSAGLVDLFVRSSGNVFIEALEDLFVRVERVVCVVGEVVLEVGEVVCGAEEVE